MTPEINTIGRVYQVVPSTRLFENLGATGQPAYKALAEFTDNSVDNRLPGRQVTVNITYHTRNNKVTRIVVDDDASGMTEEMLVKAFTIGHSSKTDPNKIGRFGMGLKTAISALGNAWVVSTATADCKLAHQIADTKQRLVDSKEWTVEVSDVPKLMPIEQNHGTRVEITQTEHLNAATFTRNIQTQLGNLFRYFIQDGTLALYVNNEPVVPTEINLIEDSVIELHQDINGKRIRGWIGLRTSGSTNYGFSLVRNGRVMEEEMKLGFAPHPSMNRIIGDIHLDSFATDHHKTAFDKNSDDWAKFVQYMAVQVKPLVEMARNLANKDSQKLTPLMQKTLNQNINQLLDQIRTDDVLNQLATIMKASETGTYTSSVELDSNKTETSQKDTKKSEPRAPRKAETHSGLQISWQCLNDGADAARKRWDLHKNELVVTVNTEHPTWPEDGGTISWVFQNVMEAIASYYASVASSQEEPSLVYYEEALDRIYRIAAKQHLIY